MSRWLLRIRIEYRLPAKCHPLSVDTDKLNPTSTIRATMQTNANSRGFAVPAKRSDDA